MKKALVIIAMALLLPLLAIAQTEEMAIDTAGFKTFSYQDGDQTYLMKQYFMCFLKSGPTRSQSQEEAVLIQEKHLAYISSLAADRKICASGPFGDDGEIRGILIFSTTTIEEAQALANADPAVQAGRLVVEIHPWWGAVGTRLF